MIILGIESSCDETACAIGLKENNKVTILSSIVASSQDIHIKYGGVVPEQAAREQLKAIIPVINEALTEAAKGLGYQNNQQVIDKIEAIAVTQGPGLIGSLLVGVETAKTLALLWHKPLIPVNHLKAHFYANWIGSNPPKFPAIGLLISGGHTDLVLMQDHNHYHYLGGTRDDAAGECFDKCARLLNLPYPGGPLLSRLAQTGNPEVFPLPKPMWDSGDFDFSFSGLKTAVANILSEHPELLAADNPKRADLAASIEKTIIEVLIKKTVVSAQTNNIETIIISGGVASNELLRKTFPKVWSGRLYIPESKHCTDNAAMVTTAGFFTTERADPLTLQANPNLTL